MAVKFPLEMKNGIQVRNISELKENFDVEKVVGYFLDGRLKKWLDARWYEEESEKISELEKNDPLLVRHLCEIFEVDYQDENVDTQKIKERNERLSKLKQYTDDEEVLKNIDAVAFDQEELADLYEKEIKKIYLCEGAFKIPKSKRDLEYELVGKVHVEGLEMKSTEASSSENLEEIYRQEESEWPQELADYIGLKNYIELDDYIVWEDYKGSCGPSSYEHDNSIRPFFKRQNVSGVDTLQRYKVWNKRTKEYGGFNEYSLRLQWSKPFHNKIIYRNAYSELWMYDVDNRENKCLYKKLSYLSQDFQVNDGRAVFLNQADEWVVLDLMNGNVILKKEITTLQARKCYLWNNKLFYEELREIKQYDFNTGKTVSVYEYDIPNKNEYFTNIVEAMYIDNQMIGTKTGLYVICWDHHLRKTYILKVKRNGQVKNINCDCIPKEIHMSFYYEDNKENRKKSHLVMHSDNKIWVLDMLNDKLSVHSENFPSSYDQMNLVDDKLYWGFDKASCKVDLAKGWNLIKLD